LKVLIVNDSMINLSCLNPYGIDISPYNKDHIEVND